MMNQISQLLATFFYVGFLPVAPGSFATAVGGLIALGLNPYPGWYVSALIASIAVGFFVSGRAERSYGKKDPGCIVIDEVAGIMIAFFMLPVSVPIFITTFFLFRAFDMFKIYPGNKFEGLGGSAGIMLDDVVAGMYTNLIMQLAIRWA